MGYVSFLVTVFLAWNHASAQSKALDTVKNLPRCHAPVESQSLLHRSNHPSQSATTPTGPVTREELWAEFDDVYQSNERLPGRAYYDETKKSFVIPQVDMSGVHMIKVPDQFLISVRKHVETALANNYADVALPSDLGQNEFYLPSNHWARTYQHLAMGQDSAYYERILADPKLKMVYKTAEKVAINASFSNSEIRTEHAMIFGANSSDEEIQVMRGDGASQTSSVQIKGYTDGNAGIQLSSSRGGCFPYLFRGKVHYFDISIKTGDEARIKFL